MLDKSLVKTIVFGVVGIALVLGAGHSFLRWVFLVPGACISEGQETIPNLSGTKIEIVYVNCDTLAKDEAINIYFSPANTQTGSWFAKGQSRRALVFSYDPGRPDNSVPSITHPADSAILISIPEVSSVSRQDRSWRGMSIEYAIGKVDYAANPK